MGVNRPYNSPMTAATANLIEAFDRLPPDEQRVVSAAIVRRAAQLDYDELTASAATIFSMLDEEEDAQAR